MITRNISNPWLIGLQGILTLSAGIFILIRPEVTMAVITRLLGIALLIAGGLNIYNATYKKERPNQFLLLEGILNTGVGILFTFIPVLMANVFIILLGMIIFLSGLINVWLHIRIRSRITSAGFLRNILLLLFGFVLLFNPLKGQEAIGVILGVFALLYGIISLYGAYKLFQATKSPQ